MNNFRAPRWCESGNACIYSNCPFRHEVCKHFEAGKCRNQKSMEKPCDGGCMYDHRDHSTLVEFVRNVPLRDYDDIIEQFGQMGIVEIPGGFERFDLTNMSVADRKLLVRSLKDGGFKFELDEDRTFMEVFEIPGYSGWVPIDTEPKGIAMTAEETRIGMMSAAEYNDHVVATWSTKAN